MKKLISALLIASTTIAFSQSANATEPTQFKSVKEMIENFHDYSAEEGTFKVLNKKPLHIQLSPEFLISPEYPNAENYDNEQIIEDTKRAIVYGIYRTFIHTPNQEITITAIPQTYNHITHKRKYLTAYKMTANVTKEQALALAQKYVDVAMLSDLVTEITFEGTIINDQWSKNFKRIYFNHSGNPDGLNRFFEELTANKVNKTREQ